MFPTKTDVKSWLKRSGRSREWLGQQCGGVSLRAVNNWLSTDRPIPPASLEIIRRLMEDDERAEIERRKAEIPNLSHVTLRITTDELNEWSRAFKDSDADTLEDWILQVVRDAYQGEQTEQPSKETKASAVDITPGELASQMYEERLRREAEQIQRSKSE